MIGMGDHVPDFILRSFKLEDNTSDDSDDEIETTVVQSVEETSES